MMINLKQKDWTTIKKNLLRLNFKAFAISLRSIKHLVLRKIYRKDIDGVNVLEDREEWHNLIVLDSCRYDKFAKLNTIDGDLEKIRSKACATDTWLRKNFTESYEDIIYISSTSRVSNEEPTFNPLFNSAFDSSKFYKVIEAYDEEKPKNGNWLPPERVTEKAKLVKQQYPDKKLIIHYFQPHAPYKAIPDVNSGSVYQYKKEGYSSEEINVAYHKNLNLVLNEIEHELLPQLNRTTIITGDHGEFLGESNLWGHYVGVARDELLEVPWFKLSKG